jgi:hypothetical protein
MKDADSLCNKLTIHNPVHEAGGLLMCPHQIPNESHYFKSAMQNRGLHGLSYCCHTNATITMVNIPQKMDLD